ncbi:MAG: diacylglycerol/polyprenol kinase family protein [Ignavibacteria bacterium]
MENQSKQYQALSLKGEFFRKIIHISSSIIPIGYYFLNKEIVLSILIPILVLMLIFEILKYKYDFVYDLYLKWFKIMLRDHELRRGKVRINGASWLLLADVLCIIIFPKLIAITGMLLLSLSDSFSAIFGRIFGKKQFVPNRSFAGSLAFFMVGIIIAFITPKYFYISKEYLLYAAVVFITTIVDTLNLPVDDNFAIPIVSSSLLYILYIIFFPDFQFNLF